MSKDHSRRAVLAGIATAPALAAPALALTSAGPDPIFAAIENHKGLNAAFSRALLLKDTFEGEHGFSDTSPQHDDLVRREDETCDAEREACDEMLATVPTTFAGVLALLRYVEQERGEFLDETAFKELLSTTVSALATLGAVS
jgi:hypothetical protein